MSIPLLRVHPAIPICLLASGSVMLLLLVLCLPQFLGWIQVVWPVLVALALVQSIVILPLLR